MANGTSIIFVKEKQTWKKYDYAHYNFYWCYVHVLTSAKVIIIQCTLHTADMNLKIQWKNVLT